MIKINRIHHVAIIASDYQKSKKFYTEILGFEIVKETFREVRKSFKLDLKINEVYQIELFSFPNPPARMSYPEATGLRHIAFEADNIEQTKAELELKGITVEPIRVDKMTGKMFIFFSDPDNLPIEIYEK